MVRNEGVSVTLVTQCGSTCVLPPPSESLGAAQPHRDCRGTAPPGGRPLICFIWWPPPNRSWRNPSVRTLHKFCKLWFHRSFLFKQTFEKMAELWDPGEGSLLRCTVKLHVHILCVCTAGQRCVELKVLPKCNDVPVLRWGEWLLAPLSAADFTQQYQLTI